MKSLLFSILIGLSSLLASGSFSESWYEEQREDEKTEINAQELPREVRMDIIENYHNATILHAYRTSNGGEDTGYLVEIKKGPKVWTLNYDKDGNPENKINPIKI